MKADRTAPSFIITTTPVRRDQAEDCFCCFSPSSLKLPTYPFLPFRHLCRLEIVQRDKVRRTDSCLEETKRVDTYKTCWRRQSIEIRRPQTNQERTSKNHGARSQLGPAFSSTSRRNCEYISSSTFHVKIQKSVEKDKSADYASCYFCECKYIA
jgi:hypothetical protein